MKLGEFDCHLFTPRRSSDVIRATVTDIPCFILISSRNSVATAANPVIDEYESAPIRYLKMERRERNGLAQSMSQIHRL